MDFSKTLNSDKPIFRNYVNMYWETKCILQKNVKSFKKVNTKLRMIRFL